MCHTVLLLVALLYISLRTTSSAQVIGENENNVLPDELTEDIDENGRSSASAKAFGAVAAPAATRLLPGPGTIKPHECYVCTDCPKVLPNTTYKACTYSADSSKKNKCVVYSEQYKHMDKLWYIRGCASERGSCEDIKKSHAGHENVVKLISCQECEGDKCNVNGGNRHPSSTAAFFILVVTPLLAKQTLS